MVNLATDLKTVDSLLCFDIQIMALKLFIIAASCCAHFVASQTATTWPPSTSVPSGFSKLSPVPACSGTAAPPNGYGTLPTSLFSGVQADLANQNSEISQMIQATCDKTYASQHANYGSCNGNVCTFSASTAEYNATYSTNTFSGSLDFCLGAPVSSDSHIFASSTLCL